MAQRRCFEPEQEQDLIKASDQAVEKGDLSGPSSEQQISDQYGADSWLFTRFPLYQSEAKKLRVIDDCTTSGINAAFQKPFKVELMDCDVLACLTGAVAEALQRGDFLGEALHPSVVSSSWVGGRLTWRAYKQIAI